MDVVTCRCDKPSVGGLTKEPCTRLVTQEDLLCDECRNGCSSIVIGPVGATASDYRRWMLLDAHAEQIQFGFE